MTAIEDRGHDKGETSPVFPGILCYWRRLILNHLAFIFERKKISFLTGKVELESKILDKMVKDTEFFYTKSP